jgi:hypothetical protein
VKRRARRERNGEQDCGTKGRTRSDASLASKPHAAQRLGAEKNTILAACAIESDI